MTDNTESTMRQRVVTHNPDPEPSTEAGCAQSVNVSTRQRVPTVERRTIAKADNQSDWLAQRAPFIGASVVAALFGEHPFVTPATLARERRGERAPDNAAMARGRRLESVVAEWWADEHNAPVAEAPELYVANDTLIATLDRIVIDAPEAVEVKTTSMRVHEVSRHWWWQCQCQLACTGFERVHVAVLDQSMRLQSFTVMPDPDAWVRMLDAARTFLDRIEAGEVIDDTVPRTADAVELDTATRELVRTLRLAQARAESLNDDIGKLKGYVSAHLGTHNVGTVEGVPVVRRQTRTVRNALDAARLRADWPQLASEYTKAPSTSTFIVVTK